MRILPMMYSNVYVNNLKVAHTKFESKGQAQKVQTHKYTGVASVDLAYASMFDSAIARDLKLMGLI